MKEKQIYIYILVYKYIYVYVQTCMPQSVCMCVCMCVWEDRGVKKHICQWIWANDQKYFELGSFWNYRIGLFWIMRGKTHCGFKVWTLKSNILSILSV